MWNTVTWPNRNRGARRSNVSSWSFMSSIASRGKSGWRGGTRVFTRYPCSRGTIHGGLANASPSGQGNPETITPSIVRGGHVPGQVQVQLSLLEIRVGKPVEAQFPRVLARRVALPRRDRDRRPAALQGARDAFPPDSGDVRKVVEP